MSSAVNAGSSGAKAGGLGANVGSSSDCEGEEQEDPSSSSYVDEVSEATAKLNLDGEEQNDSAEDELSTFRQQWQRELEASPLHTPKKEPPKQTTNEQVNDNALNGNPQNDDTSDFERARTYFVLAADLERAGSWYESIQNYKRAMAINPNIELLLYQQGILDSAEEPTPEEEAPPPRPQIEADDEEEMVEGEELLARIQRIHGRRGVLCEPVTSVQGTHISCLPYEVILLITRWVVSSELDTISLERLGATCRGLYLVARDQDIWRNICIRTWGIECGTPRAHGFPSWRRMYVERPRLHLHGCYISKTNYLRHGETGFQDQYYRPWFLVQYYRYLRFFPEGRVIMLTTPDEPALSVSVLKNRNIKPGHGVLIGHYRLRGDKVVIVMKKIPEKKPAPATNSRFRSRRREPEPPEKEQTFHIELQLSANSGRRNMRLNWKGYSVCARRDQWTEFEMCPGKFPALYFSRVRHYMREAGAPLASVNCNALPPLTT